MFCNFLKPYEYQIDFGVRQQIRNVFVKMAAKAGRVAKSMKTAVESVKHPPYFKTNIGAGKAVAAPPLGPQLGQVKSLC